MATRIWTSSIGICLLLAGCGSTSNVLKSGPDQYTITAGGGMYEQGTAGLREEAYTAANKHCDAMGRTMQVVSEDERPYRLGRNAASVTLHFTCL